MWLAASGQKLSLNLAPFLLHNPISFTNPCKYHLRSFKLLFSHIIMSRENFFDHPINLTYITSNFFNPLSRTFVTTRNIGQDAKMSFKSTEWMERMSHRKQKETKQQPGTAWPGNILGCCLVSLRFLCNIHPIHSVGILFDHKADAAAGSFECRQDVKGESRGDF